MPSEFDRLHFEIFRAQNDEWGEGFSHKPMRARPNKSAIPDPDRETRCFVGQFRRPATTDHLGSYGARDGRAAVSSKAPSVRVALVDLDAVKQDDIIERHDPFTVYTVADVQSDGRGIAVLQLLETATAKQAP